VQSGLLLTGSEDGHICCWAATAEGDDTAPAPRSATGPVRGSPVRTGPTHGKSSEGGGGSGSTLPGIAARARRGHAPY
jgi:hypothetical protein